MFCLLENTYKNAVIFSKFQNGTSGHPKLKMHQAIRYHGSKQEKVILANLSQKGIYWKEVDCLQNQWESSRGIRLRY